MDTNSTTQKVPSTEQELKAAAINKAIAMGVEHLKSLDAAAAAEYDPNARYYASFAEEGTA